MVTSRYFLIDPADPRADLVLERAQSAMRDASLREAVEVTIRTHEPKAEPARLRALMARVRDIVRHRMKQSSAPEREVSKAVEDFKQMVVNGGHLWPREADPDPDYFTGEVLYRPKSRTALTDREITGLMRWLDAYMADRNIPSSAPAERWDDAA